MLGPIDWPHFLGFTLTGGAIVLSPGPDTILILRNAFAGGRRIALYTVAGVQLGLLTHTLAATLGLSLLLAQWPAGFKIIAIGGAAYLGWLGMQSFRGGLLSMSGDTAGPAPGALGGLRDAAFTNLLNPKVILLFLALMPQFVVVARGQVPLQMLILSAWLIVLNILWQVPLALLANTMRRFLLRPRAQTALNWAAGAILLFFAGLLLWDYIF
jgi:threonine/homoserine/homoserine lactone efflux protein